MVHEGNLVAFVISDAVLVVNDNGFGERVAHHGYASKGCAENRDPISGEINTSIQSFIERARNIMVFRVEKKLKFMPSGEE